MVIGFSKKGPVNRPVLLNTPNDLTNIFGTVDRSLERSGSFFHRTINQMLLSSPVYGMNLLLTDDNLDKLQYSSLSTTSENSNYINSNGKPYRRFFDNNGFWVRDTEAFLNVMDGDANLSQRVLNFTNMSDKTISIFVYKSQYTSPYNVTLLNWYGTVDKIPAYLRSTDYVSDYLVDVLVVSGDWTNYQSLSVDSKWNKYFDSTGLKKTQTANFINDRNVNTLAQYTAVSLIPYFKDQNGNNMFIETIINSDTDKTGLYCAFDIDKYETDYPNGLIDLIGNNLVNQDINSINFLSYKDIITETVSYNDTYLDRPGNVIAMGGSPKDSNGYRSTYLQEGYINGVVSATPSISKLYSTASFNSGSYLYGTNSTTYNVSAIGTTGLTFSVTKSGGSIQSVIVSGSNLNSYNSGDLFYIDPTDIGGVTSTSVKVTATFSLPVAVPYYYYATVYDNYNNSSVLFYGYINSSTFSSVDVANYISNDIGGYRNNSLTITNSGSNVIISVTNSSATAYTSGNIMIKFYDRSYATIYDNTIEFSPSTTNISSIPLQVSLKYNYTFTASYNLNTVRPYGKSDNGTFSYAVINGIKIPINNNLSYTFSSSNLPVNTSGIYTTTFVIDTNGSILAKNNYNNNSTLPLVDSSDIVLGYSQYVIDVDNKKISFSTTYSSITINNNGYIDLDNSGYTYNIDNSGNLTISFLGTSGNNNDYTKYNQWRQIKQFNYLLRQSV